MPDGLEKGVKSMGRVTMRDESGQPVDERALEAELVNHLRSQNEKLMEEVERLRKQRSQPGLSSTSSWSELGGDSYGKQSGNPEDGERWRRYRTPRSAVDETGGKPGARFTPNGTRVPDGTPPEVAPPVPVPPTPCKPFPPSLLHEHDMEEFMNGYEKVENNSKMLKTDTCWRPVKELSPHEARAFWLEREVMQLKQSLDRVTSGSTFKSSAYWSKGFHPPTGPPVTDQYAGYRTLPTDVGRLDPDLAERISRANPGDVPGQSLGGSGDPLLQGRARDSIGEGEGHCHSLGGSGDPALQGRARDSMGGAEVQGHLHGGSGEHPLHARACTMGMGSGDVHGHLLGGCHADQCGDRAQHGLSQAANGSSLCPGHQGGPSGALWQGSGGGSGVGMIPQSVGMIPQSWETGGGGGTTKAELPELPGLASPLQSGDWIHLCGPVMRDLSSMAARWWDLTVRQAQVHYSTWKSATPLQRVQIQPNMPDELNERCYGRTEQRGVHLLLKAVAPDIQQVLVTDRQMTSTAILFRLYVRYQPGGPGERNL